MKLSPFLERQYRALLIVAAAEAPIAAISLPGVRVRGTSNGSQGVTVDGRRARRGKQRGLRSLGHNAALALKLKQLLASHGALVVHLVRVAPNRLDGDNLAASLKRVRDGLAKCIGVDDRHPSVEYLADDERGAVREYAVRVEVFARHTVIAEPTQQQRENAQIADGIVSSYASALFGRSPTPNVRKPVAP